MSYFIKFFASIFAGAVGGWAFGFVILSFGSFIGRSGNTGQEGFGYWNPIPIFGLAGFYGMPLGAIMFPIGYFIFLQKAPIHKALLLSSAGTLIGGLIGALFGPPIAALLGVVGFFIAASIADREKST